MKYIIIMVMFLVSAYAAHPQIEMETTQGTMVFELYEDVAPLAVENFVKHAKNGYYNGLIFHRIIKDFMVQGGDPTGTGMAGESIWKKPFGDEFVASKTFSESGILAMANSGPSTNGSQFFITTAPTPWLNNHHTIFGRLISGKSVLDALNNVPTGRQDRPMKNQEIISLKLKAK